MVAVVQDIKTKVTKANKKEKQSGTFSYYENH